MWKLETNTGVICVGVIYILLALVYPDSLPGSGYILILEILGAAGLCLGVYKQNPFFFLPWLLIAYYYFGILLSELIGAVLYTRKYEILLLIMPWFGILLVPFFSVNQAFIRIRRDWSATESCNVEVTNDV